MKLVKIIVFIGFLLKFGLIFSQQDSIIQSKEIQIESPKYNPLSPAKAAFYSAILPGAGQVYNNRYWWQLPLIYGGLGASAYYYFNNDDAYTRYRTAYKRRKSGLPDEFDGKNNNPFISEAGLESRQRQTKQNREFSLLCGILTYTLQIVEASVTAHLLQFDDNDSLSLEPTTIPDPNFQELPKVGLALKYNF